MSQVSNPNAGLVRGRFIIHGVGLDGTPEVTESGVILFRDGVIVAIGDFGELSRQNQDLPIFGATDAVVSPGFVNSHHHVGLTPLQLGSPDYPLELWFASRLGARTVDPYLDTLYSAFEMLESGITTVQHLHGWRIPPAARVIGVAQRILKAYGHIGLPV